MPNARAKKTPKKTRGTTSGRTARDSAQRREERRGRKVLWPADQYRIDTAIRRYVSADDDHFNDIIGTVTTLAAERLEDGDTRPHAIAVAEILAALSAALCSSDKTITTDIINTLRGSIREVLRKKVNSTRWPPRGSDLLYGFASRAGVQFGTRADIGRELARWFQQPDTNDREAEMAAEGIAKCVLHPRAGLFPTVERSTVLREARSQMTAMRGSSTVDGRIAAVNLLAALGLDRKTARNIVYAADDTATWRKVKGRRRK